MAIGLLTRLSPTMVPRLRSRVENHRLLRRVTRTIVLNTMTGAVSSSTGTRVGDTREVGTRVGGTRAAATKAAGTKAVITSRTATDAGTGVIEVVAVVA